MRESVEMMSLTGHTSEFCVKGDLSELETNKIKSKQGTFRPPVKVALDCSLNF